MIRGQVEDRIYKMWMDKGYFRAEADENKEPYCIVIPPPNITGELHMGHALDNTLQDILIRWRRMQGYSALWLPGTDHASIATEVKIVEKLEEGRSYQERSGTGRILKKSVGVEGKVRGEGLHNNLRNWDHLWIGQEKDLQWMRAAAERLRRCLYACIRKV